MDKTTLIESQFNQIAVMRRALEIIAVGDAKDPKEAAEEGLIEAGIWSPRPEAGEPQVTAD